MNKNEWINKLFETYLMHQQTKFKLDIKVKRNSEVASVLQKHGAPSKNKHKPLRPILDTLEWKESRGHTASWQWAAVIDTWKSKGKNKLHSDIRTPCGPELYETAEMIKRERNNFLNVLLESEFTIKPNSKILNTTGWLDDRGINSDIQFFACHFIKLGLSAEPGQVYLVCIMHSLRAMHAALTSLSHSERSCRTDPV
jgi:hypothetical protein